MTTRSKKKPSGSKRDPEPPGHDIINQIAAAEALRLEKKYFQSFAMFKQILEDIKNPPPASLKGDASRGRPPVLESDETGRVREDIYLLIEIIKRYLGLPTDLLRSGAGASPEDSRRKLTIEQLNWTRAHAAAAACNAYKAYADMEWLLEEAAQLLTHALLSVKSHSKKEAWTWAQLGEVYRKLGNLPAFFYKSTQISGSEQLFARTGIIYYQLSSVCFLMSLTLDSSSAWTKAHFGAMQLNRRRYYPNQKTAVDETHCAFHLINQAVWQQEHRANWSTDYLSIAHFVMGLYRVLFGFPLPPISAKVVVFDFKRSLERAIAEFDRHLKKSTEADRTSNRPGAEEETSVASRIPYLPGFWPTLHLPPHVLTTKRRAVKGVDLEMEELKSKLSRTKSEPEKTKLELKLQQLDLDATRLELDAMKLLAQDLLISLYYSLVLWNFSPQLLQRPIQPGAMEVDITYAILYDLSILLPYTDTRLHIKSSVLGAMLSLANIGVDLPKQEHDLPYAFDISQLYFIVYIEFIARTNNIFQVNPYRGVPRVHVKQAIERMLSMAKKSLDLQPVLRRRMSLPEGIQNGIRISMFAVMLDFLKTCVILKYCLRHKLEADNDMGEKVHWPRKAEAKRLLESIYEMVDEYNTRLKVFEDDVCAESAADVLYKLHQHYMESAHPDDASVEYEKRTYRVLEPSWYFGGEDSMKFIHDLKEVFKIRKDWSLRMWFPDPKS